jgi:BirA family biotin operon repressor/biotin-[acetyl-CoA-carboxylase] ligase
MQGRQRGRAGRSWYSAPGHSLTFSLAWKFHRPVQDLVGLPLAVGVALAEALAMYNVEVALKWPNDVLYKGKKLAGILIESASATNLPHPASWAVIGIGINVRLGDSALAEIGSPAIGIDWLADLDQDMLFATLASGLAETLLRFEQEGLAPFVARWNGLHAYRGQAVRILDNGRLLHEGVALGVDEIGRFVLEGAQGRHAVMAGDVSLRPC